MLLNRKRALACLFLTLGVQAAEVRVWIQNKSMANWRLDPLLAVPDAKASLFYRNPGISEPAAKLHYAPLLGNSIPVPGPCLLKIVWSAPAGSAAWIPFQLTVSAGTQGPRASLVTRWDHRSAADLAVDEPLTEFWPSGPGALAPDPHRWPRFLRRTTSALECDFRVNSV